MSKINNNNLKGKILTNKKNSYILVNKLGSGSFASVWICYATSSKNLMAIKIFKDNEYKSGKKEIALYNKLNKLQSNRTIKMYDNFTHNNIVYIVIDLMVGSLYDIMKNCSCYNNGYPIQFVDKITIPLIQAVTELHNSNIIHGDIKPENILIYGRTKEHNILLKKLATKTSIKRISDTIKTEMKNVNIIDTSESDTESELSDSGSMLSDTDSLFSDDPEPIELSDSSISSCEDEKKQKTTDKKFNIPDKYIVSPNVKLADFGSCIFIDSSDKPNNIQTKYYRAPEIILGLEYDQSVDLWALGCTLYELFTGEILFNPDNRTDIDDKRYILSKIYNNIGPLPDSLINMSPLKQVFFTDNNILKVNVYDSEDNNNIFLKLCEKGVSITTVSIICNLLKVNPTDRTVIF